MTDKFMDLSIDKTNSAYMLFYERIDPGQRIFNLLSNLSSSFPKE